MRNSVSAMLHTAVLTGVGIVFAFFSQMALATEPSVNDGNTVSPIKHVIVIIGENRTFDNVFATYAPRSGQTVLNLLSEGIVDAAGKPGAKFSAVSKFGQPRQNHAWETQAFSNAPGDKTPYKTLPPPGTYGARGVASNTTPPPFATLAEAAKYEYGLYSGDLSLVTTGASGLGKNVADTRIPHDADLPDGPFQITGPKISYDSYTGDPTHRFYQMWQQMDCSIHHATAADPTGCIADLFPWVDTTIGGGNDDAPPPKGYNPASYRQKIGAAAMGFFNMAQGDAPYFKKLADGYSIADNYHQAAMGGTGPNHIFLGYADNIYFTNGRGHAVTPPADQIENPNPQKGTNNYWINDGPSPNAAGIGGNFSNCSDDTQPGVTPIVKYLKEIKVKPNCETGVYYMLNDREPGYQANGVALSIGTDTDIIPPVSKRHIGDALTAAKVTWAYFGEDWDAYSTTGTGYQFYCTPCNPFQYATQTMADATVRKDHIADTARLYADLAAGHLPAVSFVKPGSLNDGHPGSSKLDLFESFTHKIIADLQANPALWATTAVFVIFDEGGGYWDSGYVQLVDFFGDGTRVPLMVVSPYSKGGKVVHEYYDHVSIDKFIERNWNLKPITTRSRDNLPNPVASTRNPYVPTNRPAIGDLWEMFSFPN